MESQITQFLANRIVLEYARKADHVEVSVDGARGVIRVPLRDRSEPPAASQDAASAPGLDPATLETAPEAAPAKKRGRPPLKTPKKAAVAAHSPIRLTIHGVEVNYRTHVRELVSRIVNGFDMSAGERLADEFIQEISGGA
jgi:hypothetical protein